MFQKAALRQETWKRRTAEVHATMEGAVELDMLIWRQKPLRQSSWLQEENAKLTSELSGEEHGR